MRPIYIAPAAFLQPKFTTGACFIVTKLKESYLVEGTMVDAIRVWVMAIVSLGFVVLYGLALLGKIKTIADPAVLTRVEPLVFVIIGYYFGRIPGQQNEQSLKKEIGRLSDRANAAQQAMVSARELSGTLDEKVKNARTALAPDAIALVAKTAKTFDNTSREPGSVVAAFNILSS
jgi:hypothetical protein